MDLGAIGTIHKPYLDPLPHLCMHVCVLIRVIICMGSCIQHYRDTKLVHSREHFGTAALLCLLILSPYQTDLFFSVNTPSQVRGRAQCCSPCPADRSPVFNPQHLQHQIEPHLSWLSHISASIATQHLVSFYYAYYHIYCLYCPSINLS